jgi:hypothetical protein
MNRKKDPMGRAIAEYWKTKKADRLRVFSPMFEEDEIPLTTLFRSHEDMPEIERKALDIAKGRILDVGAASGCHSLVLQERGLDVTATGTMVASDYVGIFSGRNTPDKMEKTGWTIEKAPNVNAPVFKEFPMTLECRVKQKIDESETGYYL